MTRYRIEEESDTPDFVVFLEIALALLFLPIGIIILLVKIINYFSRKKREKAVEKAGVRQNLMQELTNLAYLKDQGIITQAEFQERKARIMKKL
ncbi:MAG: SHOCT domain-containing protein [Alistipes sp.]|nr:SHOCT domain-containing protein [Alistipes sp.]